MRGTDIQLSAIVDGRAEFLFSGLRAERIAGDSLDFDGAWPNISGVDYMPCVCVSTAWPMATCAPPAFTAYGD